MCDKSHMLISGDIVLSSRWQAGVKCWMTNTSKAPPEAGWLARATHLPLNALPWMWPFQENHFTTTCSPIFLNVTSSSCRVLTLIPLPFRVFISTCVPFVVSDSHSPSSHCYSLLILLSLPPLIFTVSPLPLFHSSASSTSTHFADTRLSDKDLFKNGPIWPYFGVRGKITYCVTPLFLSPLLF